MTAPSQPQIQPVHLSGDDDETVQALPAGTMTTERELLREAEALIDGMATWFRSQPLGAPPAGTARDAHYGGNSYEASMLRTLLSVIHRDGGHYIAEHGLDKAVEDAEAKVFALLGQTDAGHPSAGTPGPDDKNSGSAPIPAPSGEPVAHQEAKVEPGMPAGEWLDKAMELADQYAFAQATAEGEGFSNSEDVAEAEREAHEAGGSAVAPEERQVSNLRQSEVSSTSAACVLASAPGGQSAVMEAELLTDEEMRSAVEGTYDELQCYAVIIRAFAKKAGIKVKGDAP